jgi:hypothetical protein
LSLSELVAAMQEEFIRNRQIERETLQQIAGITTVEFAEQAAAILDPAKHAYSFEGYLIILQNLREVLAAGVPEEYALDAVQTAWSVEMILNIWKGATE